MITFYPAITPKLESVAKKMQDNLNQSISIDSLIQEIEPVYKTVYNSGMVKIYLGDLKIVTITRNEEK